MQLHDEPAHDKKPPGMPSGFLLSCSEFKRRQGRLSSGVAQLEHRHRFHV